MIVEISPKKILKNAITVWNQSGPEVDLVLDIKKLSFKENSLDAIYAYHVLDHLFPEEIVETIANWKKCLKTGSSLFMIVDDFEYVCRQFISGDINIDYFNQNHTRPCNFSKDNMPKYCVESGFMDGSVKIWFIDIPNVYVKQDYELIFSAEK